MDKRQTARRSSRLAKLFAAVALGAATIGAADVVMAVNANDEEPAEAFCNVNSPFRVALCSRAAPLYYPPY